MTTFPTFVTSSTASTTSNSGTLTITLPSGIQADDRLLLVGVVEGIRTDATAPSGWDVLGDNDSSHTSWLLSKKATGTESGSTATFTFPTTATSAAMCWVIRGVDPATDPEASTYATGIASSVNGPGVTASWGADNNLFVAVCGASDDGATISAYPTGYNYQQQYMSGGGGTNNDQAIAVCSAQLASATGDPSLFSWSELEALSAITVAFRPIPDPPPPPTIPSGHPSGYSVGDDSSVSFSNTVTRTEADLEILVDWDGDGDFDEDIENVTGLVLDHSTTIGRDQASQYRGRVTPGQLQMRLNNDDCRFSQFNTESPLVTAPYSLDQGHKVRVQVAGTVNNDPVRIAGTRFESGIEVDDFGTPWVHQSLGGFISDDGQGVVPRQQFTGGDRSVSTLDVGTTDGVAWAEFDKKDMESEPGIMYRLSDSGTYGQVILDRRSFNKGYLQHWTRTGGGSHVMQSEVLVEDLESSAIFIDVQGDQIRYGLNGETLAYDTAFTGTGTNWGLYCIWRGKIKPRFREFQMWDRRYVPNEGVLWTGRLSSIEPSGDVNGLEIATIKAEGFLASGADVDVEGVKTVGTTGNISPGVPCGVAVGNALRQGGLLHPPGPIYSDHVIGSDYQVSGKALDLMRDAEHAEQGRLYETVEGPIGLFSRGFNTGVVHSEWADDEGAQFRFETVKLRDYRGDLVNRADAKVAPAAPTFYIGAHNAGNGPVGAEVSIALTLPDLAPFGTQPGELLFVTAVSSVYNKDTSWLTPQGFKMVVDPGANDGHPAVYVKVLTEDDINDPPQWVFYKDTDRPGGAWAYEWGVVRDWYGQIDGGVNATHTAVGGSGSSVLAARDMRIDAAPLTPPGGTAPHLFFTGLFGIDTSANFNPNVATFTDETAPHRYFYHNQKVEIHPTNPGYNAGFVLARKYGVASSETPTRFDDDFRNFQNLSAVTLAVRGREGSTLVQDSKESIAAVGAIKSWDYEGAKFDNETDAQGVNEALLASYSKPTPTMTVSFTATKRPDYRAQAIRRRLGDLISVRMTTGAAKGVHGTFSIESITHTFDRGAKRWTCEWGLAST